MIVNCGLVKSTWILIRWKDGKFCLGDAGSVSYLKEFEFDSLLDLIEASVKEIKSHN